MAKNDFFQDIDFFEGIKKGLEEALSYAKGDTSKASVRILTTVDPIQVSPYNPAEVAGLRKKLNLSQRGFASAIGVSPRTVEAWEAGKSIPSGVATRMLYLIEADHSLVDKLVVRYSL